MNKLVLRIAGIKETYPYDGNDTSDEDEYTEFSEEDEELLVNLFEDIVGEEHVDEDLESLLRISKDNLERALLYTKR